MTETHTAASQIAEEVTSWPGVQAGPGRRGELAFKVGQREVGHPTRLNYDLIVAEHGIPAEAARR